MERRTGKWKRKNRWLGSETEEGRERERKRREGEIIGEKKRMIQRREEDGHNKGKDEKGKNREESRE